MYIKSIVLSITIFLLVSGQLFAEEQMKKAIYGLPLDAFVFKGRSPEEIARYLKDCGVEAVVHVPLDHAVIEALHHNGIKAYAAIGIFCRDDNWKALAESRPLLADGSFSETGVCAANEWFVNSKIEEVKAIARDYQIDGLWLDFIRWPTTWEVKEPKFLYTCFCNNCLELFQRDTGIKLPKTLKITQEISDWIYKNHPQEWFKFRCNIIIDTVKKLRQAVKEYRKDAIIGIFVVPWRESDFDNAIYKVIGQDIAGLSSVVDVFSPMSYHLLCHKDPDWIISVTAWLKTKTNKDIWPIIQAIDEPQKMSAIEFERALRTAMTGGSRGVMVFDAKAVLEDEQKWEVQKKIFTQQSRVW